MLRYTILLFTIITLSISQTKAQQANCQQVTDAASPKIISMLNNNDFTSMETTLQTIESGCGVNEFTQRLRILSQLIQKQPADSDLAIYRQNGFDSDLIDRLEDAANSNYEQFYNEHKADYHFVPLNGAIDSLIKIKSAALLSSRDYALDEQEESILLLFSDHIQSYLTRTEKAKPVSRTEEMQVVDYAKYGVGYAVSFGVYTPANGINPVFKTNPVIGFSVMSPLSRNWVFDGFLKVRINSNDEDFDYWYYDEVEVVNSSASVMLGGSVGYKFLDQGKFLMIGKAGIAYEGLTTGLSETTYYDYPDEYGNYSSTSPELANTYNLSGGISAMYHVGGRSFLGLQTQYHYSPYNIDKSILTDMVSDYISVELFWRF